MEMINIKETWIMKLKNVGRLSLGIMILIFVMGTAMAQDEQAFSADISVDYYSKYVWRGIQVNDESVLQPAVSGSAYGFTGSIWANIDLTNINEGEDGIGGTGEFSEVDYALDYSGSAPGMKKLGYSVGVVHYIFPAPVYPSTTEIYFGVSVDTVLSPSFTVYRDVNAIDGTYMQFAVGQSFSKELAPDYSIGLDLSGSFGFAGSGYNRGYFGVDKTKWNDFTVGIGVPINLKHVSLTPSVNISTMLDKEIGDAVADRTNVWFGVCVAKSF
jgi:hypothetical protein